MVFAFSTLAVVNTDIWSWVCERGSGVRRLAMCLGCSDPREIVSHGLCAKCNMQSRRAEEKKGEPSWLIGPDRSQSKSQRELNRLRVNFAKMVALLDETPTSGLVLKDEDYAAVKSRLLAAIDRINDLQKLTVNPESELTVNAEIEA